jgi:hypothetical protein
MYNFFINKLKKEDGAVLITSLLFLMVVTVLAVIGMQSPRTDIMISGNEKLSVQAQQLANLGVMEAKNWLTLHYKPNAIPLNAGNGSKLFVVVRPDAAIDAKFSRAGILSKSSITITEPSVSSPEDFNSPDSGVGLGKAMSSSDYTLKDSSDSSIEIGTYEWNIIRISQVGSIFDPTIQEADASAAIPTIGGSFTEPRPITEGFEAAIGKDKAFWQYFYINSNGYSDGLVAESEGIASYKQIIPSSD